MTAELKQECSPLDHKFDIEYVCNQQGCKSHLLCNLCFQTHRQICPGVFGETIKKLSQPQPGRSQEISNEENETPMEDTFEDISENVKNSSTTMTAEEFIAQYNTMKLKVEQPISKLFDREKEICQKNLSSLEQVKKKLISMVEAMYETWGDEQEGKLRGMSESSQQKLTRLKELQSQVQGMHFDPANLIKNHSNIQELETNIAPEARNLVETVRQVMDGWVLNQDRISDYQEAVSRFIQGIEFVGLLNKEKLEFKASSLPQTPDDEVQKTRKEVEILRSGDLYLKDEINKLRQEIENLKKDKIDAEKEREDAKLALDALAKAKDEILAKELAALAKTQDDLLVKEKEASKAALAALTKTKDDAIANITKQKAESDNALVKEKENCKNALDALTKTKDDLLTKEKEASKAALAALTKTKDDALANVTKQKTDADAALVKEKENSKAALAALTKTKDDSIANVTKQKADADAALVKEKDANKAAFAALTKTKDDVIANVTKQKTDADTALVKEKDASKAALGALTKTKDEAIAKLTKEVNDLKAKIPK